VNETVSFTAGRPAPALNPDLAALLGLADLWGLV
jgi:hypothetical protein